MSTACRTCGKPIIWAKSSVYKKPMPIDAQPVAGGNLRLVGETAVVVGQRRDADGKLELGHVSHFATCVDAAKHRRPRVAR